MLRRALLVALLLAACGKKQQEPAPTAKAEVLDETQQTVEAFWRWFAEQAPRLATLARDTPVDAMTQIDAEIMRVHVEIGAELAPGTPPEPHTLVLTAHGIREHAPLVETLVAAAPKIDGWKVVAFRPRMAMATIEVGETTVATADVRVVATQQGSMIDAVVYVPSGQEDPALVALPILDHYLGEYDAMMKLGAIEFQPLAKAPADAITMPELVKLVDALPSRR